MDPFGHRLGGGGWNGLLFYCNIWSHCLKWSILKLTVKLLRRLAASPHFRAWQPHWSCAEIRRPCPARLPSCHFRPPAGLADRQMPEVRPSIVIPKCYAVSRMSTCRSDLLTKRDHRTQVACKVGLHVRQIVLKNECFYHYETSTLIITSTKCPKIHFYTQSGVNHRDKLLLVHLSREIRRLLYYYKLVIESSILVRSIR